MFAIKVTIYQITRALIEKRSGTGRSLVFKYEILFMFLKLFDVLWAAELNFVLTEHFKDS